MAFNRNSIKRDFKGAISSARSQVKQEVKGTVDNARNKVAHTQRRVVKGTIQVGVDGVMSAADQAMRGNFGGAVDNLVKIPSGMFGNVDSALADAFGLTSGSILTQEAPGTTSVMSSGEVAEGNAYEGVVSRADPMMNFNWFAQMPVLDTVYGKVGLPWNYVEEASVPFRSYDMNSVYRNGRSRHYASKYSVDALRLSFYMDTAGVAMKYLHAWNSLITVPTTAQTSAAAGGMYNLPGVYKKSIDIYLVNPKRKTLAILSYIEAWPPSIDSLSLESSSSGRLVASVPFSVGDVVVNLMQVEEEKLLEAVNSKTPIQHLGSIVSSGAQRIISAGRSIARNFF